MKTLEIIENKPGTPGRAAVEAIAPTPAVPGGLVIQLGLAEILWLHAIAGRHNGSKEENPISGLYGATGEAMHQLIPNGTDLRNAEVAAYGRLDRCVHIETRYGLPYARFDVYQHR